MSTKTTRSWYIHDGAAQHGPYPEEQLTRWVKKGVIAADTQFSCGGSWLSLDEFETQISAEDHDSDEPVPLAPADDSSPRPGFQPAPSDMAVPSSVGGEEVPDAAVPTRDRIVIIGRRASGKTIYLAKLYELLWKSRNGLSMKALSGRSHQELMAVCAELQRGQWPAATDKARVAQVEFELDYRGRKRTLVALDYSGEVFRDAFVDDDTSSEQAKALVSHIDRSLAVILLIDPAVALGSDVNAVVDDDYGIVQAIQRIRDWPGGEDVPVILLFTKADRNRKLMHAAGSAPEFVKIHYPALVRTLKRFKVREASAIQAVRNAKGELRPKPDSVPVNIVEPLKYCLDVLENREQEKQIQDQWAAEERKIEEQLQAEEASQVRTNKVVALVVGGLITIAIFIVFLILVLRG